MIIGSESMEEKIAESLAHFSSRGSKVSIKIDGEMQEIATIVRCKDCRFHGTDCPHYWAYKTISTDDWFCADGERKEG